MTITAKVLALVAAVGLAALDVVVIRWWTRVRALPTYNRPSITWQRWFGPVRRALVAVLACAALVLAALAHLVAGVVLLVAMIAWAAVRARRASEPVRRAHLAREARQWFATRGELDPALVRQAFVLRIHPEWGRDLAGQLARDCTTPDDLARWIAKMERANQ